MEGFRHCYTLYLHSIFTVVSVIVARGLKLHASEIKIQQH
jgi:hypothetical protein